MHKEFEEASFLRHSGAIVDAKARSDFALAIEPGISRLLEKSASQCRDSGFKACGLAPE
jgi:hypothetical protein